MQQRMDQPGTGAVASNAESREREGTPPSGEDRSAFWRAIAGMAISIAVACLIVMLEFTGASNRRAARIHRRVEALTARVSRLKEQIASERARVATANREMNISETLRAILRAPDAAILPLAQVSRPASAATSSRAATAALVLSAQENRAVLIASGLKQPSGSSVFVLWYGGPRGTPMRAAEFRAEPDGSAIVPAELPASGAVISAEVTAESVAFGAD
jgi:hypothetical protein